jgi:hypothetical protein
MVVLLNLWEVMKKTEYTDFKGNIAHLNEPYKFGLDAFNQIDMRTTDYIIIDWNLKTIIGLMN